MRIIVCFNFTEDPGNPGYTDVGMAFILGLRQLGHEVIPIEDVDPKRCLDAHRNPVAFDQWDGRDHFERLTRTSGLWPRCCLIYNRGEATWGMTWREVVEAAKTCDLALNIGGRLKSPPLLESLRCMAYVDINPAKTQVYHAEYGLDRGFDHHQFFFTVGLNIGTPRSEIPACGRTWYGTLQPVVLPMWPPENGPGAAPWTTISTWSGRETFKFKGRFSGEKLDQWLRFIELPKKTGARLEIALKIGPKHAEDIRRFEENGWTLTDPRQIRDLASYRRYIASSRGEFSVANYRYVQFNTGWFSDRSARYLASGRPVLVQATGIEEHLPVGTGLLTFGTMEEAVAGIEAVDRDYPAHQRAARALAEEYFDSAKVLSRMLALMGF